MNENDINVTINGAIRQRVASVLFEVASAIDGEARMRHAAGQISQAGKFFTEGDSIHELAQAIRDGEGHAVATPVPVARIAV